MAKIGDVAIKAGVSVTTVSRVLNNRGYISQETRDKVYRIMRELDYQPNEIARSLLKQRSGVIGLILPEVNSTFFSDLTQGIESFAYQAGFKILLCISLREKAKEREYIDMLRRHQVDGIILCTLQLEVSDYQQIKLPIVSFERYLDEAIPVVTANNVAGGEMAAQLLVDKGCRQTLFVYGGLLMGTVPEAETGPELGGRSQFYQLGRYQGFRKICQDNATPVLSYVFDQYRKSPDEAVDNLVAFLEANPQVDGVFAGSDQLAAQVIKACARLGRRIPQDMRIIGFDDSPIASLVVPGLTTISQPVRDMARHLVGLLVSRMDNQTVATINVFPVQLVERETT